MHYVWLTGKFNFIHSFNDDDNHFVKIYRLIGTENDLLILCNNVVLHRNQFMFTLGEWLPMIEELSIQLRSMNLDINAFVCLCALTVITGKWLFFFISWHPKFII